MEPTNQPPPPPHAPHNVGFISASATCRSRHFVAGFPLSSSPAVSQSPLDMRYPRILLPYIFSVSPLVISLWGVEAAALIVSFLRPVLGAAACLSWLPDIPCPPRCFIPFGYEVLPMHVLHVYSSMSVLSIVLLHCSPES